MHRPVLTAHGLDTYGACAKPLRRRHGRAQMAQLTRRSQAKKAQYVVSIASWQGVKPRRVAELLLRVGHAIIEPVLWVIDVLVGIMHGD